MIEYTILYLACHTFVTETGPERLGYLYLPPQSAPLTALYAECYNDVKELAPAAQLDLMPYLADAACTAAQTIEFPAEGADVVRFYGRFAGAEADEPLTPIYEAGLPVTFMSDLPVSSTHNYGKLWPDQAFGGTAALRIGSQTYAKGFGTHATSTVSATVAPTLYSRFAVDLGKQYNKGGRLNYEVMLNGDTVFASGNVAYTASFSLDYALADTVSTVRLRVGDGGDGNGSDHAVFGAARFVGKAPNSEAQHIAWAPSSTHYATDSFSLPLDAEASSGLAPVYKILHGSAFASVDGSQLRIDRVPSADSVVVEALQPGSPRFAPASARRTYHLRRGYLVQPGERLELTGPCEVEELVVCGNSAEAGEVVVSGLVSVKRFVYRHTFVPREWNFFSFPSELDLDKISNLPELGYTFNGGSSRPTYYVREYSAERRAAADHNGWQNAPSPLVEAGRGYLIGINDRLGLEPREVSFTIDNAQLAFDGGVKAVGYTIDLSEAEPGARIPVYLKADNVASNTLKVEIDYQPADLASLPLNHERALSQARFVGIPGGSGVRLTLPTQEPARVFIFDASMQRVLKAVRYVAPMVLVLSDLPVGIYPTVVEYGNARRLMELTR